MGPLNHTVWVLSVTWVALLTENVADFTRIAALIWAITDLVGESLADRAVYLARKP